MLVQGTHSRGLLALLIPVTILASSALGVSCSAACACKRTDSSSQEQPTTRPVTQAPATRRSWIERDGDDARPLRTISCQFVEDTMRKATGFIWMDDAGVRPLEERLRFPSIDYLADDLLARVDHDTRLHTWVGEFFIDEFLEPGSTRWRVRALTDDELESLHRRLSQMGCVIVRTPMRWAREARSTK